MQSMMVHFWQSGEKPSQELLECFLKGISMSTQGSKACPSTDGSHSISIQESEEQSHPEPHRKEIPHEEPPSQEKEGWRDCDLSLPENTNKIVASGLMYMEKKTEFITVHGRSLLNGYKKVEIKKVQSGSENDTLPVPVGDDLIVLIDVNDSYVHWPQNHIHSPSKMEIVMKEKKKNHQRSAPPLVPTILGVEVSSEFKQKLRTPLMNSLLLEARVLKASGSLINVSIDDHVLQLDDYTSPISYEELIHWCDEGEIGASHIAIFMRYLSDLSDTMKSTSFYGFLFPETLSKFASVTDDLRSDYIARVMTCTQCGRGRKLIFAAYHESDHWMLAAINPSESIVYWCDPAGYTEPRKFIMEIINRAFEKRNSIDPLARFEAKPVTWRIIKCPRQPDGSVLCGYYICRYMLELIKGRYINITPNFMLNAPKTYTVEQIDEVRNIWAEFTLNFKPKSNGG
ncbi:uncharacterized protein LOC141600706 [Silene latifolia]|uniref:uncharacterized protein LOC141600706 n=1 Tax=Silene latifolia TaxID=37657 RepID=UPI003D772A4F